MQGSCARGVPSQLLDSSSQSKSKRPTASSTIGMNARSDDSSAAVAAAAALAEAVAAGGALPASATVEAMEAGAALSPPPSPRASVDATNGAFAFDTARLSRSPPRFSPPLGSSGRALAAAKRPPRAAEGEITTADPLQREPSLSPEPTLSIAINSSDAAASASAAAAALAAAEHESAATDFVRTRRMIQLRLVLEIERKLRLADESAELKADRDSICGEIFSDITGEVDEASAARLGIPWHANRGGASSSSSSAAADPISSSSLPSSPSLRHTSNQNALFYEVLAPFLAANPALADALLGVMRRLWGQAYVAPVYALLLHRWLLTHRDAGLRRHRTKHVHVLAIGAQQLFWADVHSDAVRFQPLFGWLAGAVALDPRRAALDALPLQCRAGLLAVVAAFLPYYATSPRAFAAALAAMPSPRTLAPPPRGCPHAGGVDLVLTEAADMLGLLKSESSILVWLRSLRGAAARPALLSSRRGGASRAARLRLQSSLHALTARGGPRYLSPNVRAAAFDALDDLFPAGAAPRRLVAVLAAAWARAAALWASTGAGAALAAASGAEFWSRGVASVVVGAPLALLRDCRRRVAARVDDLMRANVVGLVVMLIAALEGFVGRAKRRWTGVARERAP